MYPNKPLPNPYSPTTSIRFVQAEVVELVQPVYVVPAPTGDELLDEMLELQAYRAHQVDVRKYEAALEANLRKLQSRYHYYKTNSPTTDTTGCFLCKSGK